MKQLLITLFIILILGFFYLDKFVEEKGLEIKNSDSSINSAVNLLVSSKIATKPYSKKQLEKELLIQFPPEIVEEAILTANVDFTQQASLAVEQKLLENPNISEEELVEVLVDLEFTDSEISIVTN